jgi:hypothetical protein
MSDWKTRAKPASDDWKSRSRLVTTEAGVEDVSSPEISTKDRLIAKNLAQSVEKQAAFLKSKYPNLDIKVMGSDVLVRRPEDASYKKLDSSRLELADIGDVADVVGAGLASTAGVLGGGAVGGIPGALAGTAASGSAYEALRQKLGQKLGIPQDVSAKDAALAGALNAAGSAVFGTGIKAGARGAYEGLVRQGWNKGIPKTASYWFGAPEEVIDDYVKNREAVEAAVPARSELAQDVVDRIRTALSGEKAKVGKALGSSIEDAKSSVNIEPIIEQYQGYIAQLQAQFDEVPNAINKAKLDEAKSQFGQLFSVAKEGAEGVVGDTMSPSAAFRLQGDLKDFGDLKRIGTGINPRFGSSATQAEKDLSNQALGAYQMINKELDRVTDGASPKLKAQYRELMQMQGALSSGTNTPQQAYSTLTNLSGKSKTAFREQLEKLSQKSGESFTPDITRLQAAEYFGDAGFMPRSIGGTTSTSRTVPATAIGGFVGMKLGAPFGPGGMVAGGALGAGAGNVLASPRALKAAIDLSDAARAGANNLGKVYAPMTPIVREGALRSAWEEID